MTNLEKNINNEKKMSYNYKISDKLKDFKNL